MTYKCLECGHIFEPGDEARWTETHGLSESPYENFSGCPVCHGAYAETVSCNKCGGGYLEDELYDGICFDCLRDAITYERALDFMEERGYLIEFMFNDVWDSSVPRIVSNDLMRWVREAYLRMAANDRLLNQTDFLDRIQNFILTGDGLCGRCDYAEWVQRGVRN